FMDGAFSCDCDRLCGRLRGTRTSLNSGRSGSPRRELDPVQLEKRLGRDALVVPEDHVQVVEPFSSGDRCGHLARTLLVAVNPRIGRTYQLPVRTIQPKFDASSGGMQRIVENAKRGRPDPRQVHVPKYEIGPVVDASHYSR